MVMQPSTTTSNLDMLREQTVHLLTDVAAALNDLSPESQADRQRLLDIAQDLRETFFLIAIIGEFNAGKSSFINAMLGEPLLPMGITPTTESIELVRYNPVPNRVPVIRDNTSIREWGHPNTGAPGVALVDTPGTGSVFQRHESVAKSFLHRADLVIFVMSAKRALADSERMYLDLARQYGKKIILVVNQVDLLEPNERDTVRRFVEQQVMQQLDLKPLIFMVSARQALAGEDGGLGAIKAHLRGVLAQTPPAQQKLLAQLSTAQQIINRYAAHLREKYDTVSADSTRAKTLRIELEQQAVSMGEPLKLARREVEGLFDGLRQRGTAFIEANLNWRRILPGSGITREKLQLEFAEQVIGRTPRDLADAASAYVNAVVDNSRTYWRGVIDRLNKLKDELEDEIAGLDATAYAQQREELDAAIYTAERELRSYQNGHVAEELNELFESNMAGFRYSLLSTLGGVVLVILAIAPAGPIIGGAAPLALPAMMLGAPLALVGGWALSRSLGKVSKDTKLDYLAKVDALQKSYGEALDIITQKESSRLSSYGMQVLMPVFSRLDALVNDSKTRLEQIQTYQARLNALRESVEAEV
jgi:small GTP-binding protein